MAQKPVLQPGGDRRHKDAAARAGRARGEERRCCLCDWGLVPMPSVAAALSVRTRRNPGDGGKAAAEERQVVGNGDDDLSPAAASTQEIYDGDGGIPLAATRHAKSTAEGDDGSGNGIGLSGCSGSGSSGTCGCSGISINRGGAGARAKQTCLFPSIPHSNPTTRIAFR